MKCEEHCVLEERDIVEIIYEELSIITVIF